MPDSDSDAPIREMQSNTQTINNVDISFQFISECDAALHASVDDRQRCSDEKDAAKLRMILILHNS